jgi:hypothetical protein
VKRCREGRDEVKVLDGKEVLGVLLHPPSLIETLALWTMAIPTGVEENLLVGAMVALLQMPSKGLGAAGCDGCKNTPLMWVQLRQLDNMLSTNMTEVRPW